MILDQFNRQHDYLRIALTDNCNLRCLYCMPDEKINRLPDSKLMSVDEIYSIAKIFVKLGVKKIRLTGGEPLLRKGFDTILEKLSTLPVKLHITTNGVRLNHHFEQLRKSGIQSINISLDTLDKEKFILLTRRNEFLTIYNNIFHLINHKVPVRINVVVMKGINDNELIDFVMLSQRHDVHVRFIEFMPFYGNDWHKDKVITAKEILEIISAKIPFNKIPDAVHDTAKKYQAVDFVGTFSIISTMSQPFCSDCNRMRLTADGKMKNCLFSKTETDLLTPFRKGEDIEPHILNCVYEKEKELGGQMNMAYNLIDTSTLTNRSMINIGG